MCEEQELYFLPSRFLNTEQDLAHWQGQKLLIPIDQKLWLQPWHKESSGLPGTGPGHSVDREMPGQLQASFWSWNNVSLHRGQIDQYCPDQQAIWLGMYRWNDCSPMPSCKLTVQGQVNPWTQGNWSTVSFREKTLCDCLYISFLTSISKSYSSDYLQFMPMSCI